MSIIVKKGELTNIYDRINDSKCMLVSYFSILLSQKTITFDTFKICCESLEKIRDNIDKMYDLYMKDLNILEQNNIEKIINSNKTKNNKLPSAVELIKEL